MTTTVWASAVQHTTSAQFQAWGSELSSRLQSVGLSKTSDTGQINWGTVAIPAANTVAGYEVYAFNDTLQSTAPIYIKILYGSATSATIPALWAIVGTATDGAGNMIGNVQTAQLSWIYSHAIGSSTYYYPSYICYNASAGFLGIAWKLGLSGAPAPTVPGGFLAICRTVNTSGQTTGDGAAVYVVGAGNNWATQNIGQVNLSFLGLGAVYNSVAGQMNSGTVTGNVSSSLVGTSIQLYKHYTITPAVENLNQVLTHLAGELGTGTTFNAAPVGTQSYTYVALGPYVCTFGAGGGAAPCCAMLWQ
jgi:hypothetical protein